MGFLVLYSWPAVVMVLFNRFTLATATAAAVIAGYLFLPVKIGINLPVLPVFDKFFMTGFTPLAVAYVIMRSRGRKLDLSNVHPGWLPRDKVALTLLAIAFIGAFLTVLTNGDRVRYGVKSLPPLSLYDAFSSSQDLLVMLLPLLLARKFLGTPEAHARLLGVICIMGLIYSLPTLFEARMSPQLNKMIYGFFPHDWRQHIRGGGYRPVVFLSHGLLLGIFLCCAVLATAGYMRIKEVGKRWQVFLAVGWLLATLIIAKTLAALIFAILLLPAVLLLKSRSQMLVAAIVAGLVLTYPMLRATDLVPTQSIYNMARSIDEGRANSLAFRFENEDILLAKAQERPLFGWGGWGRSRVFDAEGKEIATTDGAWVIVFGVGGWVGYIGRFGLLTIPILLLFLRQRRDPVGLPTSVLSLVLCANLVDLLPNAGLTPVLWCMAGALIGRLEYQHQEDATEPEAAAPSGSARKNRFARPAKSRQPAVVGPRGSIYARARDAGPKAETGRNVPTAHKIRRQNEKHNHSRQGDQSTYGARISRKPGAKPS